MDPSKQPAPGSGVPDWFAQLAPRRLTDHPALLEATWAALLSLSHATYVLLAACYGIAITDGSGDVVGPHSFYLWLGHHVNGLILGYIFGGGVAAGRARTAADRVLNAASPQNGAPTHDL